jgi:hypothetical protein
MTFYVVAGFTVIAIAAIAFLKRGTSHPSNSDSVPQAVLNRIRIEYPTEPRH